MNRAVFYDCVRDRLFSGRLTQSQVDGIKALLDYWDTHFAGGGDARWLAYVLATVHHETARTFRPIDEIGRGAGKEYGRPDPETGKVFFGRGYVQLTHKENYARLGREIGEDLVHRPELLNTVAVSAAVTFIGMVKGLFTGKKLADYFNADRCDWVNARKIINGTDRAELIAGHARHYYNAVSRGLIA